LRREGALLLRSRSLQRYLLSLQHTTYHAQPQPWDNSCCLITVIIQNGRRPFLTGTAITTVLASPLLPMSFNTNPAHQPSPMPIQPAKQSIERCNPTASFKIKPIAPSTHCGLSHPSVENSVDFWARVKGERYHDVLDFCTQEMQLTNPGLHCRALLLASSSLCLTKMSTFCKVKEHTINWRQIRWWRMKANCKSVVSSW
jgi:hypothetical protein